LTLPAMVVALLCVAWPVQAEQEVRITHGGLTLNALWADHGSDQVVLILHGTIAHNDMEVIRGLREAFAEATISTLAINLSLAVDDRHGMYDCEVPTRHRESDAEEELLAWLDWLKRTQGDPIVLLLGHSRGANQVARFAAGDHGKGVAGVAMLAPPTWNEQRAASAYAEKFGVDVNAVLDRARQLASAGRGDELMANTGLLYCDPAPVSANAFLSYYEPDPLRDSPTVLARITRPTLVIAGSEDTTIGDLIGQLESQSLPANQRLEVVEGAGHFFRDLYAYDVVDRVVSFMAEIERTP